MNKQITLKELAKLAGTSLSAVSKALNDSDEISDAVKIRINELARQYNYHPNQIARSLRTEKSRIIGMLIPDNANLYYASLLKGAEDVAKSNNYSIVIGNTNEDPETERKELDMMLELRVAGLLASPVKEENYDSINIPFVFLSRCHFEKSKNCYNYAINDDYKGAYLATEHLIKQGKKKVFFICGPSEISIAEQRTQGYKKALETYGIEFKQDYILYGNITMEQGYESLLTILRKWEPPFGVFCSSDNLAIGVLSAARSKGYGIPEDIGIVGYDDIETLKYLDYPLTTISQAIYQIGSEGSKILIESLLNKPNYSKTNQIIFEPKLVVRKT